MHLVLIDNYDSFTYNLYDYLLRLGARCTVLRNDAPELAQLEDWDWDALVLSPGPQRPEQAGQLLPLLRCYQQKKPILGICLGHQAIGSLFGAQLKKAAAPVHGKSWDIRHVQRDIFAGLPQPMQVMRYHSLILEDLPPCLEALAHSPEGELMALRHREWPIWGLQFHPESILTPDGLQLLANWLQAIPKTRLQHVSSHF